MSDFFDFSNVVDTKQNTFEVITNGEYTVTVTDYKIKNNDSGGIHYVSFMFTITSEVHTNRAFWVNYMSNDVGRSILKKTMEYMGLEKKPHDTPQEFLSSAIGKEVKGFLKSRTWGENNDKTSYNFYANDKTTTKNVKNYAPTAAEIAVKAGFDANQEVPF